MQTWSVPGLSVVVVQGEGVQTFAYGALEVGGDAPVDEHTRFPVASLTKAFTATSVALLVDSGELAWDDKVVDRLPGFQLYDPYVTANVTVEDLLSHRTGLDGWAADHLWQGSPYERAEILRRVRYQPAGGRFRDHFGYSNVMYIAAGELVAAVTGSSWDAFVAERLLGPLGMQDSTTSFAELSAQGNVITPHIVVDGELVRMPLYDTDNVGPAAGLSTSAHDLGRWLQLQLADGELQGQRVVSQASLRATRSPHAALPAQSGKGPMATAPHPFYGMGWFGYDYQGQVVLQHGGMIDGARAMVVMVPDAHVGVAVLTNEVLGQAQEAIAYDLLDQLLGVSPQDWVAQLAPKPGAEPEEPPRARRTRPSLELQGYAGTYSDALSGDAEVRLEDGHLVFAYNAKYTADLEHWHHDTFSASWRDPWAATWAGTFVSFELDEAGEPALLRTAFDYPVSFQAEPEAREVEP